MLGGTRAEFDEANRDQVRKARGLEGFEQGEKWLNLCIEKSIDKKYDIGSSLFFMSLHFFLT